MSKKRTKKSPGKIIIAGIILVILGFAGINAPDALYEYLGMNPPSHSQTYEKQEPEGDNPGVEDLGKSNFSKSELTNQSKGYIVYEDLDSLKRPQGAYALLKKNMINTGTPANRDVRPPGFVSGTSPYFHSRGHLIGRQLGGSGDEPKNLATLYQNPVNTPYMTTYENQVRDALEKGDTVFYKVTVEYEGDNVFPKAVVMEGKSLKKNLIDFHIRIYNLQGDEV